MSMESSIFRGSAAALITIALMTLGGQVAHADPPPGSIEYQAQVLKRGNDNHGREVILRRGFYDKPTDSGFGYDKLFWKHNVADRSLPFAVVANPGASGVQPGDDDGDAAAGPVGDRWWYEGVWQHRVCDVNHRCDVIESVTMRVIVEFETWQASPQSGDVGMITAYCKGMLRCPDWLNHLQAG
jgi:hypothetical protein